MTNNRKLLRAATAAILLTTLWGCAREQPLSVETLSATVETEIATEATVPVTQPTAPTTPEPAVQEITEPTIVDSTEPTGQEVAGELTETELPETEPLETDPPATEPESTTPPTTEPAPTDPPATEPEMTDPPAEVIDTAALEAHGRAYAETYGYWGNPHTGFNSNAGYFPPSAVTVPTMAEGYRLVEALVDSQYRYDTAAGQPITAVIDGQTVRVKLNILVEPTEDPQVFLLYCFYGGS